MKLTFKRVIGSTTALAFGTLLTIGAVANTDAKETPNTLYSGVTATLMEYEGQEIYIDTNHVRQVALDNYYFEKWLEEQKRQLEEIKRQQEEIRITEEGECRVIGIPTKSYSVMSALIEITEPNGEITLEPYEYGIDTFYRGLKTYMDYRTITAINSPQYALEHISDEYNSLPDEVKAVTPIPDKYIYTDDKGFRRIHSQNPYDSEYQERYVIAVGSGITSKIGQYVDLILESGEVIPCIVGDQKADAHTDTFSHIMTSVHNPNNTCVSEFIVEQDKIPGAMVEKGDSSYALNLVGVKVDSIKVYNKNILR